MRARLDAVARVVGLAALLALALGTGGPGRRPLEGLRVFVTRPRHQTSSLVRGLRAFGAEPLEFPAIRIAPPADPRPLADALNRLAAGEYAWLIVTSANTVDALRERWGESPRPEALGGAKVAAVGPATTERLRQTGLEADLVPQTFTGRALADALPDPPPGAAERSRRALLPASAEASDAIPRVLEERGWRCDVVDAYRVVEDTDAREGGRRALDRGVDAVLFTSGSTARSFRELWGAPPERALVCCIGPTTAHAARTAGLRVDVVADTHTVDGLLAALADAVRG